MTVNEQMRRLAEWYDQRSMRERLYMVATLALLLLFLGWQLVAAPLLRASHAHLQQMQALRDQQARLETQVAQLHAALKHNPNDRLQQQKQQLTQSQRALETELHQDIQTLVSPARMVSLLRQMLVSRKSLQLESVRHLTPRLLKLSGQPDGSVSSKRPGDKAASADANSDEPQLYAHDVELVVSGSYFQILDYLKALEGLHQRFGWRLLDYQVQHYPKARMRLKLETLSLDKEWIGA